MKKSLATSLGKAAAFSAISLAVSAAVAQSFPNVPGGPALNATFSDPESSVKASHADVKINKQLVIVGQPPVGYNPQFSFNVGVTENALPDPPNGCTWDKPTYQPAGGNTTVATGATAQITVVNRLVCPPPPPSVIACQKAGPVSVSLLGAATWNNPGSYANVSPLIPGWKPNSSVVKWVGKNVTGGSAGPNPYESIITFCLCGDAKATADVNNYIADNKADIKFDAMPAFLNAAPRPAFSGGTSGSGSVAGAGTHKLRNTVSNATGPTGWTMNGTLAISKGYLGACVTP